ncbi:MAG: STAS domain-containing protein [Pseudomonadota bacterium]|nr:STAS domain-containing protein [Pseudomonadota bacterium]
MASTAARITAPDLVALRAYWAVYEPAAPELSNEVRIACENIPEFGPIMRAMTEEQHASQQAHSLAMQRQAILGGNWDEYVADLTAQGIAYAQMGIGFGAWFRIIAAFRTAMEPRIVAIARQDMERATAVSAGMNCLLDLAMGTIGDAYLLAKEEIIRSQQEAIREISTPVLQIRDKVLILPVVGMVDTHRARLLTETLLGAIRARRARAVVMDITGVPLVDSKVAKHLAQTCEAARLMGATVLITGISQEIAQTLVTIGVELSGVRTLGDLQSGIEEVERMLNSPILPSGPFPGSPA